MTRLQAPERDAADALANLPRMGGARVLRLLADGPTNVSYLVEHAGERFVLRLDKAETAALGLNRQNERTVCAAVAVAGLAPAYHQFDLAAGVCLRPFVAGRSLDRADLADRAVVQHLATVLRRLHGLAAVGDPFAPLAAVRRYAEQLGTPGATTLAARAAALHADLDRHQVPHALCHNDLVCDNVLLVEGQGLLLIDWEYAGVGDPWFDLAVVVRHHDLGDALAESFLEDYLQRSPTPRERQHLARQCAFYSCLLELWNLRIGM